MKHVCDKCGRSYVRKHDLNRHKHEKHANDTDNMSGVDTPSSVSEPLQELRLQHPFSMVVAGPSGSGKTMLIKQVLEERSKWIQPPPERILWLYDQWQPMYDEMTQTIPGIEFYKGIPSDIEKEHFLDQKTRNLIVLDDLMVAATKDVRICEFVK